jgi:hypothetical protein
LEKNVWKRRKKDINAVLLIQEAEIVKHIKSVSLRCYGHVERMQNQRTSKQTAIAKTQRRRKRERPRKRW